MRTDTQPSVAVVYRYLPQYRVDFFQKLREEFVARDIRFELLYGTNGDALNQSDTQLGWATPVKNKIFRLGNTELQCQSIPGTVMDADLLVLMQETKLISNFGLQARRRMRRAPVAFWGHGINFQEGKDSYPNRLKLFYSKFADWWFAYTPQVAEIVADAGFPREKITVLNNAIDTKELSGAAAQVTPSELDELRRALGLVPGPVALFCGGMYKEKRIAFLLEGCQRLRKKVPSFQMLFLGTGPESHLVKTFCQQNTWSKYVGPIFGLQRVPYMKLADVFLMPGLVGLVLLDSFAVGVPLVTTPFPFHSPEFEYLKNGENGLVAQDSVDGYVAAVAAVVQNADLRERLRQGCALSAEKYSVEHMVERFVEGTESCLGAIQ